MPREQGHFREGVPRSTSKVAKDKSNTSALQAARGGKSDLSKHMLRRDSGRDSGKDSGYSEAGSDDQRSSRSKPGRENGKNLNGNAANAAGARRSAYGELPPVYVIRNLVVQPSTPEQLLHGPLAWSGGWHGLAAAKPQTGLVLLRQPAVSAPPSSTPTSSSRLSLPLNKGSSCNKQSQGSKNSYLPILNSYPRIAPHPRKDGHEVKETTWAKEAKESGGEGHSPSKRVCIEEEKWDAVSTTSDLHRSRQHSGFSSSAQQQSSGRDSVGSPSVSSSQTPSPPSLSDSPLSSSPPSSSLSSSTANSPRRSALDGANTRERRFLNTAEILNQSGLLAITLRAKELLKQNTAADRELAQLRQHTQLLCQAAQAGERRGNKSPDSLDKLLRVMKESGSYPGLDVERLKTLSRTRNHEDKEEERHRRTTAVHGSSPSVVFLDNVDDGTSPPSPLFAPSPDPTEHLLCFLPEAPT